MFLTTGTIFQAENKLKEKNIYKFFGIETDSMTGCDYIHLYNLTRREFTWVEYQWFRERKLTQLRPGSVIETTQGKMKIYKLPQDECVLYVETIPEGKYRENSQMLDWTEVICVLSA